MVELVDTQDLKSCDFGRAGSTPALGTNKPKVRYNELSKLWYLWCVDTLIAVSDNFDELLEIVKETENES